MRFFSSPLRAAVLVLLLLPLAGTDRALQTAAAEVSNEARTPGEIFERKPSIHECMAYVARDLKARWEADTKQPPAVLLLVVDPTTSMKNEIAELRSGLEVAWSEGPKGMRIGVYGVGAQEYAEPSRLPTDSNSALSALSFLPLDGPKNVHAEIRGAAKLLRKVNGGPKAMLFVSEEGGEGEDDVEATRDAVLDSEAAFYCIAGESAFERCWIQDYEPRPGLEAAGLSERYNPLPRKKTKNALYMGGDTAFGLVPYRWEFDLAQTEFYWVRPPKYPVPSGYGYWSLATLAYSSGGRYFVFDFAQAALNKRQQRKRKSLYDYTRLAMVAPDLRPRSKILKSLNKDWRAHAIVRIWQHLANEATPIIGTLGTLERRGASLQPRPARPLRSTANPRQWYTDLDEVREAKELCKSRIKMVEEALKWWSTANGREREEKAGEDPLKERLEADFQFLGVQLKKVQFHWYEALSALDTITELDVTYREVQIRPGPIAAGVALPRRRVDLKSEERNARFAEVMLAQQRLARKFPRTPWALCLQKGHLLSFSKNVRIVEQEPERRRPETNPKDGEGDRKREPKPKPKPPRPSAPPPPGPRPGSGAGGPTTGG